MAEDELPDLDALLDGEGDSFSLINPEIVQAAAEIAESLLKAGFQAWEILLNRGVLYTEGETTYCLPADSEAKDVETALVTTITWSGDREGELNLVLPELAAKGVVAYMMALMMGTEDTPENTQLDEDGMDAYNEAINNFLGAASQALRESVGGTINLSAASTAIVPLRETGMAAALGEAERLVHSGQMTIEGMVPQPIHLLMPVEVTGRSVAIEQRAGDAGDDAGGGGGQEDDGEDAIANAARAMKMKVPVVVVLAEKKVRMEILQKMSPGTIIEFRKQSGELLDVCARNVKFGEGEVVIIHEHFGVQLKRLVDIRAAVAAGSA
jgi:flagellar motor switch/type III secretory pathway protein FliN